MHPAAYACHMMAGSRRTLAGSPSSPPQRRRRSSRLAGASSLALVAALLLSGCFGSDPETAEGVDGDFADDGCTNVVVATSSEKVNMLDALADAFKDSAGARRARHLRDGASHQRVVGRRHSVSHLGRGLARRERAPLAVDVVAGLDGVDRPGRGSGIALPRRRSRVVHAHPRRVRRPRDDGPRARLALGRDRHLRLRAHCAPIPAGWGSVGKELWGSFKISKTNPNTSTTGCRRSSCSRTRRPARRRPHGGGRRRSRGLLAGVRGVRHPLRRHHRQGALAASTTRRRTASQRLGLRLGDRASRRPRCSTTTRATPTRTRSSPARRSRRRRRSSSRSTPRAARCGPTTRSRCSAPTG